MKRAMLLFFILLVVGCSRQIRIEDYSLEEEFDNTTKEMIHNLHFTLYNPYNSPADCNATLYLSNGEITAGKNYSIGEIAPGERKAKNIRFIMPEGEIALNLTTDCSFE